MTKRFHAAAMFASVTLGLGGVSPALADAPDGHVLLSPDKVKWVDNPALPGAQTAVLLGNPKKPGPYVMRVKFPPNTKNPPHTHPDNRNATVISGTWNFGHGDRLDAGRSTTLPPGTFFTEPAGSVHYNFTTTDTVVIQISGTGPTSTDYIK